MDVQKNVAGAKRAGRSIKQEYRGMFNMEVRDPETLIGDAVIIPFSRKNYRKFISSMLPRWNRLFAPKHWCHTLDYRNGDKVIIIQRDK